MIGWILIAVGVHVMGGSIALAVHFGDHVALTIGAGSVAGIALIIFGLTRLHARAGRH